MKSRQEETPPAKSRRTRWATYLPDDTIEQIRRAAHNMSLTTGEVVEIAVAQYVAREEKKRGKPFGPVTRLKTGRPLREA